MKTTYITCPFCKDEDFDWEGLKRHVDGNECPKFLIHQSIKNERIACGLPLNEEITYTPICAAVTCPECLKWQDQLVEAVFKPLE